MTRTRPLATHPQTRIDLDEKGKNPMRIRLFIASVALLAAALSLTLGGVLTGQDAASRTSSLPREATASTTLASPVLSRAATHADGASGTAAVAVAQSAPQGAAALFEDLLTGLASGDTAAYATDLERRIESQPDDSGLHALLGLAYQQLARETADPSLYSRAKRAYDRSQQINPDDPIAATGQASVATIRHRFVDGARLARRALELSPNNATAYAVLGDALLELGRYDAAFAAIDKAAELGPTVGTYARVATARELVGRQRAALSGIGLALELARGVPEHRAWTLVEGGNIALRAGKEKKARRMYAQALREVPGYVHAQAAQAALAATAGDHDTAARSYRAITERLPLPAYFITLAHSLEELGRDDEADAAFDRAAEIIDAQSANGVRTELARAELLLARGSSPRRALSLARKGFADAPNVEAKTTLAWALLETGQCRRARARASQALRLGTPNATAFALRGLAEICLGNDRAGARWLARAEATGGAALPAHAGLRASA